MPNRLAAAPSPYLRSHADNPVDWWPWGPEAFAEAAERDVPVLVSIGYSTCHWCHVMARESFSDPAIAEIMNETLVAIKVDREEHAEVDTTYLAAAAAFTPNLGWPLNVFVTPQGRAFFAGTYWPPQPVGGHASFRQVLDAVREAWRERRAEVEAGGAAIAGALAARGSAASSPLPDLAAVLASLERIATTAASVAAARSSPSHPYCAFSPAPGSATARSMPWPHRRCATAASSGTRRSATGANRTTSACSTTTPNCSPATRWPGGAKSLRASPGSCSTPSACPAARSPPPRTASR
jgi:hypothetical protein